MIGTSVNSRENEKLQTMAGDGERGLEKKDSACSLVKNKKTVSCGERNCRAYILKKMPM